MNRPKTDIRYSKLLSAIRAHKQQAGKKPLAHICTTTGPHGRYTVRLTVPRAILQNNKD